MTVAETFERTNGAYLSLVQPELEGGKYRQVVASVVALASSAFDELDRSAFDGELGWATDKAIWYAGLRPDEVVARGPNYGQNFEVHAEVYCWIYDSTRPTAAARRG